MRTIIGLSLLGFLLGSLQIKGQWTQTHLSSPRTQVAAATDGSKLYFAGGYSGTHFTSNIDVYNTRSASWGTLILSEARALAAGVYGMDKIIFAGGYNVSETATVDIFDIHNYTRKEAQLSEPRFSLSAQSYGDEVLFAGGATLDERVTDKVDIYDIVNNSWKTDRISLPRCAMGSIIYGSKAYFAGGYLFGSRVTDRIDIYDFENKSWDTTHLSLPRGFVAAAVSGTKILFAGGMTAEGKPTDRVDIFDVATLSWAQSSLSYPRAFIDNAASACGKAFFMGGCYIDFETNLNSHASDLVDIYDATTNSWTLEHLSRPVINNAVVDAEERVYSAGGQYEEDETLIITPVIDVYDCLMTATQDGGNANWIIHPNPCSNVINIESLCLSMSHRAQLSLFDIKGQKLQDWHLGNNLAQIDLSDYAAGMYYMTLIHEDIPYVSAKAIAIMR